MTSKRNPPSVSIIVPCYNEGATIKKLLEAIHSQTYPQAGMEVVIADGMSTDNTRQEVANFAATHPELQISVVDNPKRIIPAGLNHALREAHGQVIVRLDGHSRPYPDYVEKSVADLESGLGDNVGGSWEIQPGSNNWIAAAIAVAASHPLGAGDALYRHATKPASVDTVPFGAFKRELLATIGFFNESLQTNEDYEFNARIRLRGGTIWLDPAIRSIYFSRSTFHGLAQQYWRYGYWKWQMLRHYPGTLRWRQALPPVFVAGLVTGLLAASFFPALRIPMAIVIGIYLLIIALAGMQTAFRHRKISNFFGVPVAIFIMHVSWGSAFLWSMIGGNKNKNGFKPKK